MLQFKEDLLLVEEGFKGNRLMILLQALVSTKHDHWPQSSKLKLLLKEGFSAQLKRDSLSLQFKKVCQVLANTPPHLMPSIMRQPTKKQSIFAIK